MAKRLIAVIISLTVVFTGSSIAIGDTVQLKAVKDDLQLQDLANLADPLGLRFKIFDYDVAESHCVHFFVDEISGTGDVKRHDGHGLCGLAGPQRLTIQWKVDQRQLDFQFMRYRRDIEQGGSVSGPTILIPSSSGLSEYGIKPPEIGFDTETVLYHGAYGWNEGPRLEFKVLAELRRNPDDVIGTE